MSSGKRDTSIFAKSLQNKLITLIQCKNPIGSEVRTFDQDVDDDDEASADSRQGLVPRLRKQTWDNFIEMATGRAVRPRLPGIPQAPV